MAENGAGMIRTTFTALTARRATTPAFCESRGQSSCH
jgi:hypothetical protein